MKKAEFLNVEVDPKAEKVSYELNGEKHKAEIQDDQNGIPYFIHYFEDGAFQVQYVSEEAWLGMPMDQE